MKLQLAGWLLGTTLLGVAWIVPEPENPFVLAGKAVRVGPAGSVNYLLPLLELRQQRPAYLPGAAAAGQAAVYWQALATYAAMADETDSAAYYWRQQPGYAALAPATAPMAPKATVAAILTQTQQRQVVMFNEEHTQPRGRWLVGSLRSTSKGFATWLSRPLKPPTRRACGSAATRWLPPAFTPMSHTLAISSGGHGS
jgi:hypothetical protein